MTWDFGPDLWDNEGTTKDGPEAARQRRDPPGLADLMGVD